MSRITFLTVLILYPIVSYGQNFSVTFTGTGSAITIDSVTATNQRTNQTITLPGNETLVLALNTGIPLISELTNQGMVFPNPFPGQATFTATFQKPQTVYLYVQTLVGQVVAKTQAFVQPGEIGFGLSLESAGVYTLTLTTAEARISHKIICTESKIAENSIQYLGAVSNNPTLQSNQNTLSGSAFKSLNSGYTMAYNTGDMIHYQCKSGIYTTVLTDSPASSKNYEVFFTACTDLGGKNYSVVKIGGQIWMAENLAYLPFVSPSTRESETAPFYYVYNYEGSSVSQAKTKPNFATYGVLYNWAAAKIACPSNWHLPTDTEWKILETSLGMSQSDADIIGWRESGAIGKALKFTSGWAKNGNGDNSSGFASLPGGSRYYGGDFYDLGDYAYLWTASESGLFSWGRILYYHEDAVFRDNLRGRLYGFSVRCVRN